MDRILFVTVSSYQVENLRNKNKSKTKEDENESLLYESPRRNQVDSLLREFNTETVVKRKNRGQRKSVVFEVGNLKLKKNVVILERNSPK